MAYQQVLTPGHRASVEAEGRRFDVRVTGDHGKICRNKRSSPTSYSGSESMLTSMADLARLDLADLLGVGAPDIRILDIHPYGGKNQPTGCTPQCAGSDSTCGYIIGLVHDGRRYDYHAADGHAEPCPPILRM